MRALSVIAVAVSLTTHGVAQSQGRSNNSTYQVVQILADFKANGLPVPKPELKSTDQNVPSDILAKYVVVLVDALPGYMKEAHDKYLRMADNPPLKSWAEWTTETSFVRYQVTDEARSLVVQFSTVLKDQGIDPDGLVAKIWDLKSLQKETADVIDEIIRAQEFPDVPDNHWAYETVEGFKKQELVIGYHDGLIRGAWPETRMGFAKFTIEAVSRLEVALKAKQFQCGEVLAGRASREELATIEKFLSFFERDFRKDVVRMLTEFGHEVRVAGADRKALLKRVDSARPLFESVARSYWAARRSLR